MKQQKSRALWPSRPVSHRECFAGVLVALVMAQGASRIAAEDAAAPVDAAKAAASATWAEFQNGGCLRLPAGAVATRWSPEENVAWSAKIQGYGQSTPVIRGDDVYVTSVSGDRRERYHLAAFGLSDGKKRWQVDFDNPTPAKNTPMLSRAAPTPLATASSGCVALFEGGILASVGREGEILWQRDLVAESGPIESRHGLSASVTGDDRRLYVWIERSEDPWVMAIDPSTGETVWRAEGLGATSWASPRLVLVDGAPHLVCSASGKIVGFDPETGDRLWELSEVANNTSCTPVPVGGNRFLVGASDGRGETGGSGAPYNGVVEVQKTDEGYTAAYLWNATKAVSSFGTPVIGGGTACIVNRAGVLYRLDAETGERISTQRTSAGGIWATPIIVGDLLYLFGSKGTTAVISLESGEEVAANRLWEATEAESFGGHVLYAAAVSPPYLLLRRGDMVYAVKNAP